MKKELPRNLEIKGIGVSEGAITGRAFVLADEKVVPHRRTIGSDQTSDEKDRFINAVDVTKQDLTVIKDEVFRKESLKEHVNILKAHIALLEDKMVINETLKSIEKDRINAEWAFASVMDRFIRHFEKIQDPYIRERKTDLEHLKDRVLKNLLGKKIYNLENIIGNVILIAFDLSPADTARLNTQKVKGIITEMGSKTSHTAIIAKALSIPAVVAAEGVLDKVTGGDLVIVDGRKGLVVVNPDTYVLEKYEFQRKDEAEKKKLFIEYARLEPKTTDGVDITVKANIELPEEVKLVKEYGAGGVGLYRTEFIFLNRKTPPTEEEHYEIYHNVAKSMYPREVTIRTFDLGGDKIGYHHMRLAEKNPALGLRAIRFCLAERKIFKDQIRAILRASVLGNVKIMFPLLSTTGEVKAIRAALRDVMRELDQKGIEYDRNIKIGVMIEVPSAVVISDVIAKDVDFFSIGTNDLIQYTLAIDRSNEYVAHLYDPLNLAIIRLLDQVLAAAKKNKIAINICGEMAGEPRYMPLLIGMGFRELSMNPSSLPLAKKTISYINAGAMEKVIRDYKKKNYVGIESVMKKIREMYPGVFEY